MTIECGQNYVVDIAKGQSAMDSYEGADCETHAALHNTKEAVFVFQAQATNEVTFTFQNTGGQYDTWRLFALDGNSAACSDQLACLGETDVYQGRELMLPVESGDKIFLILDGAGIPTMTTIATLHVACGNAVICGNGQIERGETCDDNAQGNGDGCSSQCAVEQGWGCRGEPSVCHRIECGDGFIDGDEKCDDDNPGNQDGCSSGCVIETGWSCVGEPSVCTEKNGETCGDAVPVNAPMNLAGSTEQFNNDVGEWEQLCGAFMEGGPDSFYQIAVPAHTVLHASAGPDNQFTDMDLFLSTSCTDVAGSCVQESGTEGFYWVNNTNSVSSVFLAVDSYEDGGQYQVAVDFISIGSMAAGQTCAAATRLTQAESAGSQVVTANNSGFLNTYHGYLGACADDYNSGGYKFPGFGRGPDQSYVVKVPAGKTLNAAISNTTWDDVLVIADDCADIVASCQTWKEGEPATQTNDTGADKDYYVIVDGFSDYDGAGSYTLTVTIN